jgi:transcription elongation factor GreA
MKSYATTKEGLEKAKQELSELRNLRRPEISERIAVAKDRGDLSENFEYHEAKEAMSFLEGRIQELDEFVKFAVVTEAISTEVVGVGCRVKCHIEGKTKDYHVVGSRESDPAAGRISNESPLGQALLGRRAGDEFDAQLPAGPKRFKIVEINCSE